MASSDQAGHGYSAKGVGEATTAGFRFDPDNDRTYEVKMNTDGTVTINNYTMPVADGSNGQFLKTDGAGGLTFADATSAGTIGGADTQVQFNSAGTLMGKAQFTYALAGSGALSVGQIDLTASNVTYIAITDSIQTAINNAAAGDTLVLASGTYAITAALTINKALNIRGQGVGQTTISTASAIASIFTITASNVSLSDMSLSITGTFSGSAVLVDGQTAATTFSGVVIERLQITISSSNVFSGIRYGNAGGIVRDCIIEGTTSNGSSSQAYGILKHSFFSATAASTLYIFNTFARLITTNASFSGATRALSHYMNPATSVTQYDSTMYVFNSHFRFECAGTQGGEAIHNQGPGVVAQVGTLGGIFTYVWGSSLTNTPPSVSTNGRTIRNDDNANLWLFGTDLTYNVPDLDTATAPLFTDNTVVANNFYTNTNPGPQQAPTHLSAQPVMSIVGQRGGDKPGTGSTTGLVGAPISLTAGPGGGAPDATVTGAGGSGGSITFRSGSGGDVLISTSSTNTAGPAGQINILGGVGGNAANASTTNTGGKGGNVFIAGGTGGAGTQTVGSDGTLFLGMVSDTTNLGRLLLNLGKPMVFAPDDATPDVRYSSYFITTANTTATAITDLDFPTPGQIVVIRGASATTASTISDGGNFKLTGAITLTTDTVLGLLVIADNSYIELFRSVN